MVTKRLFEQTVWTENQIYEIVQLRCKETIEEDCGRVIEQEKVIDTWERIKDFEILKEWTESWWEEEETFIRTVKV